MSRRLPVVIAAGLAALLVAAWALWWFWPAPPAAPLRPAAEPGTVQPGLPVTPAPAPAPLPSAPASAPAAAEGPIAPDDAAVQDALAALLGRAAVLSLLQTDGFAARVVATVDNLPRGHVAPRVWPVVPTGGRFTVEADGRIAAANDRRYDAVLGLLDSLPPAAAAALYRRLSPQLDTAYAELGYPGQRFHTRLLAVIDHLLATPAVSRPLSVTLTEVQGPIAPVRPWVRYEFADPSLQQASAGQRLLMRLGPRHQRRVLDWLRALRQQL